MAYLDVSAVVSKAFDEAVQDKLAELRARYFTEAAELLRQADCAANETDGMDKAADLLTIAAAGQQDGAQ